MQSDITNLSEVIESILFVAGQGVEIKDIADKLEVKEKVIKECVESLKIKYANSGINVITYKDKAQMCSNPIYSEDIATVLNPIKEKQLTRAALETAAIIAYKQPITKLEIEQTRGIESADYAVQILLQFKLIEIVGRKDAVGKPLLYGTTDEFLKRFELNSIEDLPDYDELLERIKLINEERKDEVMFGSVEGVEDRREQRDAIEDAEKEDIPDFLKDETDLQNISDGIE